MGDIALSRFEARIRFESEADLSRWPGDVLRSGFGARLRALVCAARPGPSAPSDCSVCQLAGVCVYDFFYNSHPPADARVLRAQRDIPRPFVFDPPLPGRYSAGSTARFGFTLIGRGIDHMPYFLVALKNLGESGMSRGYRRGYGRFTMESVDSIGYGERDNIFSGGMVFNRSIRLSYQEMLRGSTDHIGDITIRFLTPVQIKENDQFTAIPSFRGLISRLLFRANALAEFYGSGMLYDNESVLALLGECRSVTVTGARIQDMRAKRYFHRQRIKMHTLPPFFRGEITYTGEFSRDVMALLELGRIIHVGKMATFGNGLYEVVV
ncbi:MAG: CRISPR system precrRNA processing endoribonuclease RAMP protein Cas6 [Methanothrix sp.]|nr:CRISPR system precrRNA processing endoribonuclease RAMP protein Cas6 [Methanothrix sp.]MCX8207945.1 CRISPR system precrRNA processing endoribonuclease RAMP protein Cas6 [Methanothrix sp.]